MYRNMEITPPRFHNERYNRRASPSPVVRRDTGKRYHNLNEPWPPWQFAKRVCTLPADIVMTLSQFGWAMFSATLSFVVSNAWLIITLPIRLPFSGFQSEDQHQSHSKHQGRGNLNRLERNYAADLERWNTWQSPGSAKDAESRSGLGSVRGGSSTERKNSVRRQLLGQLESVGRDMLNQNGIARAEEELDTCRQTCSDLRQRLSNEQAKFDHLVSDFEAEIVAIKAQCLQVEQELVDRENVIREMEEAREQGTSAIHEQNSMIAMLDGRLAEVTRQLNTARTQNQIAEHERDEAQRRLGELMSARLRDNNPNIVDLNDKYRPQKLGEMFSELYDNQWSDAFTSLEGTFTDTQAISFLLDIVMDSYGYCKTVLEEKWKTVTEWHLPNNSPTYTQTKQALKEGRKLLVVMLAPSIAQKYTDTLTSICTSKALTRILQREELAQYIQECVKVSLLMNASDPPVYIHSPGWTSIRKRHQTGNQVPRQGTSREQTNTDYQHGAGLETLDLAGNQPGISDTDQSSSNRVLLNKDITREYTVRGRYIDYNVWPAILLYKDGPMLGKGIAQGTDQHSADCHSSRWVWWS